MNPDGEPRVGAPTARGRATRARILDAAAQLILERGVPGTSIEDVRTVAGVSGSQMTHYFRDKRTLVQEVIAWQADAILDEHRAAELRGFTSLPSLRLWADLVTARQRERHCQGGCTFGALAGQLVETDADARADLADGFERWLELLADGLDVMRTSGELVDDANPKELAYALLGGMQGGMLLTQTLRDIGPLETAFDSALEYVATFASNRDAARVQLRLRPMRESGP